MPILSPVTDNCPTWISIRERMVVEMISFPWKDVAGREDRTRDRLHIRQMRIRPSCHARLRPSKNSLSCIIPRALFKPFKQMGWKWRFSEGTTRLFTSRTIFSSQTNLPASVSWYTAFVNLSYELKMKSVKIILGGSWGQSPPEAKSYSFLKCSPLPTCYSGISLMPVCVTVYCR